MNAIDNCSNVYAKRVLRLELAELNEMMRLGAGIPGEEYQGVDPRVHNLGRGQIMKFFYISALSIVLISSSSFADTTLNINDIERLHETYNANQARFAHDFVGKTFTAPLLVSKITENLLSRGSYLVSLGSNSDVSCSDVTVDEALAFNKDDTVTVSGTIYDHTFGIINLNHCVFSRSVAVAQPPQAPLPAPPATQPATSTAPTAPSVIYVPQPAPPPQIVYIPQPAISAPPEDRPESQPAPAPRQASAPDKLQMNCHPEHSTPYFVTYNGHAGTVLVTGSESGRTRSYPVREIHDNTDAGIFYVNAKRDDQPRTLFFAFNYSNNGNDGGIRVKGINPDGTKMDMRDSCTPVSDTDGRSVAVPRHAR
ncbi:MAG TPA: hypothetical protein VIE66_10145 [Methylocella sp.]